jgi:ubiquinone/menaquinone biosynthesis C-methylase UbiE/uncharacterized protein YbaR (Trm112 family)
MRLLHFETLQPICPACKQNGRKSSLNLTIGEEVDGDVTSGLLKCEDIGCGRTYPIIFGCPVIVPDVETWLSTNLHLILQQNIPDANVENIISELVSPDMAFNITRQQQSSYCADHFREEFSRHIVNRDAYKTASTVRNYLSKALELMPENRLPCIDVGCAVGGTTFDIVKNRKALTIGVDLNWPLLSIGRGVLSKGIISYPHRIIGNRYERRSISVSYPSIELCDFWIADATCLPFRENEFGLAIGLNIIDCLSYPPALLIELLRIAKKGAGISIACPFDWASHSTHQKNWIYGGSQLDEILRTTTDKTNNKEEKYLIMRSIPEEVEWSLPLHERSKINYLTRLYAMEVATQPARQITAEHLA